MHWLASCRRWKRPALPGVWGFEGWGFKLIPSSKYSTSPPNRLLDTPNIFFDIPQWEYLILGGWGCLILGGGDYWVKGSTRDVRTVAGCMLEVLLC